MGRSCSFLADIFQKRLCIFDTSYTITRKTSAKLVRKITYSFLSKVKAEIECILRENGDFPCYGRAPSFIVVVPKPNGSKRLCINLTHINKSIQRVIHPIASVDDSLVKLVNCRTFSNLDTRREFWQKLFAKESRYNTIHFSQTILD